LVGARKRARKAQSAINDGRGVAGERQAQRPHLGADLELVENVNDARHTPTGSVQPFAFGRFTRK
jgi:hypothetical protein